MSFTSIVKNEVSKMPILPIEAITELSAIVSNNFIDNHLIKITSENASVARRIYNLIKEVWNIVPKIIVRQGHSYYKNYIYILEVSGDTNSYLEGIGLVPTNFVPESYITDDEDILRAYIRGLFLVAGSINDPKKSRYHLEFIVDSEAYATFISDKLNLFSLGSKYLKRENKYMVYVKEAEKIGDFLRIIGATNAVLYYEDIRIYRDHKNMTNRLNNCEQANVDKIIATADEQIKDINIIKEYAGLNILSDKEKLVVTYREKYPEASLLELVEIINVETNDHLTKSGLYHRLKKIKELANKFKIRKKTER